MIKCDFHSQFFVVESYYLCRVISIVIGERTDDNLTDSNKIDRYQHDEISPGRRAIDMQIWLVYHT